MKISKIKFAVYTLIVVLITSLFTSHYQANAYIRKENEYKKFEQVMYLEKMIEKGFYTEVDKEKLFTGMKKGLFQGLDDPYSEYYTKEEMDELSEQTSGELIGIGVIVGVKDNNIVVISPIKDSPAMKAGVKAGDIIYKVNGEVYDGKQLSDAIDQIKLPLSKKKSSLFGKPDYGTVSIDIMRGEVSKNFVIPREEISLETVESKVLDTHIGYIQISQFAEGTSIDFIQALEELKEKEIKALIIDLRNNPGGLLDEVRDVADAIMGEATIVYTQDRDGKKEYIKSKDGGQLDIPMVVLVNGGSASASEVLSGAVRDNEIGTLVGETTFGKALVQQVRQLSDGSGFKLTVQQYFTPAGENINHKGISPDVAVTLDEKLLEEKGIDTQLNKAKELLHAKIK